ncbi:MAG: hypothetical protein KBD63_01770 [Bacteriovoracaceae bacterium]|nr:hypothetical protein [Bacteriovoracaceae bacterium]
MRYLWLFLIFCPFVVCADALVSVDTSVIGMGDLNLIGSPVSLLVETNTATSDSTPHQVYLPLAITGGTQANSTLYRDSSFNSVIPTLAVGTDINTTLSAHEPYLRFYVKNLDTGTQNIYLSAYNGSEYKVVSVSSSQNFSTVGPSIALASAQEGNIYVRLTALCASGAGENCYDKLSNVQLPSIDEFNQLIYIFPHTGTHSAGTTIPSGTQGIYLKINGSTVVPSDPAGTLFSYVDLKKGDTQLKAIFDNADNVSNGSYKILAIAKGNPINQSDLFATHHTEVGDYYLQDFSRSGTIFVTGLTNDQTYHVSLGVVNKYQFVSPLTVSKENIPQEVEAFLKETSCYILSAGFQDHHPVLNYFRKFRDEHLLTNKLGKQFVLWYYKTAPHYAPVIYKSAFLSALVRIVATILFAFMSSFKIILLLCTLIFLYWSGKKIFHQQSRKQKT